MTRKQYVETYNEEKALMESGLYPYESTDRRAKAKMLSCRASLLCEMIKKEDWEEETKDREIEKILTNVGVEIVKAEGETFIF